MVLVVKARSVLNKGRYAAGIGGVTPPYIEVQGIVDEEGVPSAPGVFGKKTKSSDEVAIKFGFALYELVKLPVGGRVGVEQRVEERVKFPQTEYCVPPMTAGMFV
ncbi:hypothetical protein BES34_006295 [Leptospira inadai serovar Lyme]|uniref:Uncharacterized protein n=1 Tax=Leptospira inadai serovar Lyme TaxID=293084 RepID=A0ABX4YKS0_9LEPT|nr:hypothetical protein BES34_006295 [Leptospira inadai serovar Lyme]